MKREWLLGGAPPLCGHSLDQIVGEFYFLVKLRRMFFSLSDRLDPDATSPTGINSLDLRPEATGFQNNL